MGMLKSNDPRVIANGKEMEEMRKKFPNWNWKNNLTPEQIKEVEAWRAMDKKDLKKSKKSPVRAKKS